MAIHQFHDIILMGTPQAATLHLECIEFASFRNTVGAALAARGHKDSFTNTLTEHVLQYYRQKSSRKIIMTANLDIDQSLLNEAFKIGGKRTKKETVNEALQEYIQHRKQKDLLKLLRQIDFDPKYNYKSVRENR